MADRQPRPDLDERFTLHPLEGEELRRSLGTDDDPDVEPAEDEGS